MQQEQKLNCTISGDIGNMMRNQWPKLHDPDLIVYLGQCDLYHGPVILHYILKTFCLINVVLEIFVPFDTKIELISCVDQCELYASRPCILKTV